MTSKERFTAALEQEEVDRVPYGYLWFGAGNAVLAQLGASMKDVYYSAKGIFRAQVLAREMYHHDNVMSPWGCLLVEAEALGTRLNIKDHGYPTVGRYALDSAKEYDKIKPRDIERSERVKTIAESVRLLKKELEEEAFVTGSMLSPLMLAAQVLGGTKLCVELIKEYDSMHALLETLTESCLLYADCLLEAGADGILVENGESTADLFSQEIAEEFMLEYTKELYAYIQENEGYVISHNCAAHAYHKLELELKPDALNFAFGDVSMLGQKYGVECLKLHNHRNIGCGPRYCIKEFKEFTDSGICLMGNINPNVFSAGSAADIEHEVKNCMEAAPERGFILATGCEIPLNTQPAKMEVLSDAIRSFVGT